MAHLEFQLVVHKYEIGPIYAFFAQKSSAPYDVPIIRQYLSMYTAASISSSPISHYLSSCFASLLSNWNITVTRNRKKLGFCTLHEWSGGYWVGAIIIVAGTYHQALATDAIQIHCTCPWAMPPTGNVHWQRQLNTACEWPNIVNWRAQHKNKFAPIHWGPLMICATSTDTPVTSMNSPSVSSRC